METIDIPEDKIVKKVCELLRTYSVAYNTIGVMINEHYWKKRQVLSNMNGLTVFSRHGYFS